MRPPKEDSKYRPLYEELVRMGQRGEQSVLMTFAELTGFVRDGGHGPLPESAFERLQWWENDPRSPGGQCRAWLAAGWRVVHVDLVSQVVTFSRGWSKGSR